MSKRLFGQHAGYLLVALAAAVVITVSPALTQPSAAGNGPVYLPQPWPQQWPQQGPLPGTQQGPASPQQWQQQWLPPGPAAGPQQAPPPWAPPGSLTWQSGQQSGPQAAPPAWPLGGQDQWPQQQWWQHPVSTLFTGLADLRPRDIALTRWQNDDLVLWRGYPVTLVDVESVLYDDEIDALLDAIDYDRIAGDNSDGLTGLLQDAGILWHRDFVVGADLVDGPPAFFILSD